MGNTVCKKKNSNRCPPKHFQNADGDCQTCEVNFFQNKSNKNCEKCPPGSVSSGGSVDACKRCPAGQIAVDTKCGCPEGRFLLGNKCQKCPPGTERTSSFVFDIPGNCRPCGPDTVTNETGTARCKDCPECLVPNSARTKCVPCPNGLIFLKYATHELHFPPSWGRCVSPQTNCPPGFKRLLSDDGLFRGCHRN